MLCCSLSASLNSTYELRHLAMRKSKGEQESRRQGIARPDDLGATALVFHLHSEQLFKVTDVSVMQLATLDPEP